MKNELYSILIISFVILVIGVSFYFAKRFALSCSNCGSKRLIKTGNKRDIERSRQALIASPMPSEELEYKCQNCDTIKWSAIERIYSNQ